MKKVLVTALLLCCILFAKARPFLYPTPIDNGSFDVPTFFRGVWKEQTKQDFGKGFNVQSNPNVKGQLHISEAMGAMRPAVLSKINDRIYLSLYEQGAKGRDEGYYIFRVEIIDETEIKLTPLLRKLNIPEKMSLKDYLSQKDLDVASTEEDYSLWLTNNFKGKSQQADRTGREINVKKK